MNCPRRDNALSKAGFRSLAAIFIFALISGASVTAFAAQNYQTDIDPTPRNGRNSEDVQGRGTVKATLDGNKFSVHGTFHGLTGPATEAHLCMGIVMGGTGPSIYDLTITQAQSGEISGTVTLTPDQIVALNSGKIYVLLDSQKAPKGNLWGWFQPAHVTVGPDVPQEGHWYIPNILKEENAPPSKRLS